MNELYPVEGAPAPTPKPSFLMDSWNVLPPDAEHPYYRIRAKWPGARFKIVNVYEAEGDKDGNFTKETKAIADAIGSFPDLYDALECADDATLAGTSDDEVIDALYQKWEAHMAPYIKEWVLRKPDVSKESKLRLLAVQLRRDALQKARGEAI